MALLRHLRAQAGAPKAGTTRSATSSDVQALLASHGLAGKSTVDVIDALDRLPLDQRPADLRASVRPGALEVSDGDVQESLPIPGDRFYLSIAPYATTTHDCFYHSLTTCKGELGGRNVHVLIKDDAGKVLVDEARTTFANGFVGFWLPRNIHGTSTVTYQGKTGQAELGTGRDDPTCLTTLKVA